MSWSMLIGLLNVNRNALVLSLMLFYNNGYEN